MKERQKRNPNVTTQRINQTRFEEAIAKENAKISHKIKQMRGVRTFCLSFALIVSSSWMAEPSNPASTLACLSRLSQRLASFSASRLHSRALSPRHLILMSRRARLR